MQALQEQDFRISQTFVSDAIPTGSFSQQNVMEAALLGTGALGWGWDFSLLRKNFQT